MAAKKRPLPITRIAWAPFVHTKYCSFVDWTALGISRNAARAAYRKRIRSTVTFGQVAIVPLKPPRTCKRATRVRIK